MKNNIETKKAITDRPPPHPPPPSRQHEMYYNFLTYCLNIYIKAYKKMYGNNCRTGSHTEF